MSFFSLYVTQIYCNFLKVKYRILCCFVIITQLELFLSWCLQLAEAEQFLAQNGVVHLDMKMDNILVSEDGVLKICDFGFAVQLQPDDLTRRYFQGMAPGGNPAHLAPEVLETVRTAGKAYLKLEIFFVPLCKRKKGEHCGLAVEKIVTLTVFLW